MVKRPVSIVLPLYNKESSIQKTVTSVLNQTYSQYELLIVDDGSTDGSLGTVEKIKTNNIRIITQLNNGVSSARNLGMKHANYDLIAFIDGDDFWENSYLEQMIRLIEDYPDAGFYGSNFFRVEENHTKKVKTNFLKDGFRGYVDNYFSKASDAFLFQSSSIIINRLKIGKNVNFDERIKIGEDIDFWLRVAYQTRIAFLNLPLSNYNLNGPNSAVKKERIFQEDFLFYTSKYKEMENNDFRFRRFIHTLRLRKIPEVVLHLNAEKKEVKYFLSLINTKNQSLRHKIFMLLPLNLKLQVVKKFF